MNDYYFLVRDKKTDKLKDVKKYSTKKDQEDMDVMVKAFNLFPKRKDIHIEVKDKTKRELIDLALQWKNTVTLKDVKDSIDDMVGGLTDLKYDIDEYIGK